jgi:hypothetical protein
VKLKAHYETDIYPTEDGYVAIKQPDPDDPSNELFIYLTADQLPQVIQELQDLLNEKENWQDGEGGDEGPAT